MKKNILIIIAIAAAGLALWYAQGPKIADAPTGDESAHVVGKNAIYVTEQKPGNSVLVEFALLAQPGFVVIHESRDGEVGAILGASALLPGNETSEAVLITLSRAVKNQEELAAMLHRDDGDMFFNPTADLPLLENEAPVMMEFHIDENAPDSGPVNL